MWGEWHILSSQKNKQYESLKKSAAIFNHSTKLANSLVKLFFSFAYLAITYVKNGNNNTELFRTSCLDTTGICSWIIVAKVFMWLSSKYSFFSMILYITHFSWCFHISPMLSTFPFCSFVLKLSTQIKVCTMSPGTTTYFSAFNLCIFCTPFL